MRLLVHVEGETEESFVNEVLRGHLLNHGYTSVAARLLGNARQRQRRGGARAWSGVSQEILKHLRQDPGCIATMMVDFYALPATGTKAWPGRKKAADLQGLDKATAVEEALAKDLRRQDPGLRASRFVPFVVLHEFEGLLFSDSQAFAAGICQPSLASELQAIRDRFESPEHINDDPLTAPSKRVLSLYPQYQKPLLGSLAMLEIGLSTVRRECAHFNGWLETLEQLAP
ncbi:MAG: DUF4276 family protein [Acidobacteriota bacterium]